ncbi:nitrate- and nitrite sensing domain-containing protein [Marinomonas epiphytica]
MSLPIIGFICLCIGLIALSLIRYWQNARRWKQQSLIGIDLIQNLIEILKLSQQHRGLHSGFLNGQVALKSQLTSLEQKIDQLYQQVETQQTHIAKYTFANIRAEYKQWQRLLNQSNLDASQSFQQHSALIKRLLDSIWDLADDFGLTSSQDPAHKALFNRLVRTLPELAESLGQVRALTMQVSNSERCTPDKKLHLLYTLNKIETEMDAAQSQLTPQAITKIRQFVEEVRSSVHSQALASRNPEIFFQQATSNIDAIFGFIQQGLGQARNQWS